ncbi:hypothetical protein [Peribacillus sp. S4]|uniref:hypothetical protein n=1 Tax=Peribacillus sp. S4 TaxID=3384451 RepID=UPI003989801D
MKKHTTRDEYGNFRNATLEDLELEDVKSLVIALGIAITRYQEWGYDESPEMRDKYENFLRLRKKINSP